MKYKINNGKKKLIVIMVIFMILFFTISQFYNNRFIRNFKPVYRDDEKFLKSSSTLTYTESFQTLTYRNNSITNSSGWGNESLFLPHQEVINISNFDFNFNAINSIRTESNLLFIADNSNGLKILNLSNPMNPTLVSQFGDLYNLTFDIAIQGKYAYVADGVDGLEIIDISNLTSLEKINSWSNGYNITNVLISDGLAFLSVQDAGIEILNISNPYSLVRVGNWSNNRSPCNVVVKNHYLFIASENYKLEVLDFSDLNNIINVGELPITNRPYQIRIKDDYVYLANGIDGLKVIDVKDVSNPKLISTFNQDGSITNILIKENYAFLANNNYELSIVDILNPFNLKLTYQWEINEEITSIEVYGDFAYLACVSKGIQILKLSEIVNLKEIYKFSPNINAQNVILDDNIAYLCSKEDGVYDGGLFIFNISNPYDPQNLGNFSNLGFDFYDIEIDGEICYAATYDKGLISLNISDPANIYILDSIGGFGIYNLNFSRKLEVVDDFAFVANYNFGLDIYNISDPLNLQHITSYPGDFSSVGFYNDVIIRNDCAFVAKGSEGLEIFNISNLNNIQSIANYSDSYNQTQALEFWGNYLLVADRFDGLEILDISDINSPQKVSQYTDTYNRATNIEVIDNLAIISDLADGIEIINISNPLNPVEIASYSDNYNNSMGCGVTSRFLYIADAHDGLQIVQYKEHFFNQYEKKAIAQSLEIDKTIATITNATMIINGEIPDNTSIQSFLSNDNGNNWDSVSNNSLHIFGTIGSELIWKVILSTNDDLVTPKIFDIMIYYSVINTPPTILNPSELQELAIWNQPEDFGFFEINLAGYKDDIEFEAEYLYWSVINLNSSLVSVVQDGLNKDLFRFYSIDNVYGNDEFDLILEDEGGAQVSLNITLNIYSINDAPIILNPSELQELAIWNQPEDFGFFEIDLAGYKDDVESNAEYLNWSVINLNNLLVSVVQDGLNKDLFKFYSLDNVYGSDEFDLMLEDEGGAYVSLDIILNIYNINDAPIFIDNNITIQQEKNFIQIEYEAEDIDNLPSELNYSIYYGTKNDWYIIKENYKDTTYTWDTTHIQEGNYSIKIVVSDGIANDTWISPETYSIKHKSESPFIYIIIISSSVGGGVGLSVLGLLYIRARKRKKVIPSN